MNVTFEEKAGRHGARLGIATLDAEKTLNALSLPMIEVLDDRLRVWAEEPDIVCVLLRGKGPKGPQPEWTELGIAVFLPFGCRTKRHGPPLTEAQEISSTVTSGQTSVPKSRSNTAACQKHEGRSAASARSGLS